MGSENSVFESESTNIVSDTSNDAFSIVRPSYTPETSPDSVLKKDIWLFDSSIDEVKHASQLILISPSPKHCIVEESKIKYTTYVSTTPKSFKREIGVTIDTDLKQEQVSILNNIKFLFVCLLACLFSIVCHKLPLLTSHSFCLFAFVFGLFCFHGDLKRTWNSVYAQYETIKKLFGSTVQDSIVHTFLDSHILI